MDADDPNPLEQTTEVFRDGANRRLDFEFSENLKVSRLQKADGTEFIIIPAKKVYAGISAGNKILTADLPEDYSLEHLLHTRPIGATYEKIGTEVINERILTKYRLDFGNVAGDTTLTTQTYIWIDETLGFPIKTEVVAFANGQPFGAKSTMEMRDFSTETPAEAFEIPKDFRKISMAEMQAELRK